MRIAVSGASGFVGKALVESLRSDGHSVIPLVRFKNGSGRSSNPDKAIGWDPATGFLDPAQAENLDGFIHLAGKSIADGRWNDRIKQQIRDSRVQATQALAEQIVQLETPPRVVVSASAIGIYGNRNDQLLDEDTSPGDDFLSHVANDWEQACSPIRDAGIRVVHPRIGIVLHPSGGALGKMLPLFQLFLGGRLGSGNQYWSWISRADCVRAIQWMLENESLEGPFNLSAPEPLTNAEFTRQLGACLGRPTMIPAPAFALRLALGEMADALLLNSCRVSPQKLQDSGFSFEHEQLGDFLKHHFANRDI